MARGITKGSKVRWFTREPRPGMTKMTVHRGVVSKVQGDTALVKPDGQRRHVKVNIERLAVMPLPRGG